MVTPSKPNMLPENTAVTRADVASFFASPQGKSKNEAALRAYLANSNFSEEEIEKAVTDLPSYL